MSHSEDPTVSTPIQGFSDCHAGIVSQLHELGRLPALVGPARQARELASQSLQFFDRVIREHHEDEERELFPAVLASAIKGEERERVRTMTERLTREHRRVEAEWTRLRPAIEAVARGADADLDEAAVSALVADYWGHAAFEEQHFLPLAQAILGRNSDHMAALGLALHMRHVTPELLRRARTRL